MPLLVVHLLLLLSLGLAPPEEENHHNVNTRDNVTLSRSAILNRDDYSQFLGPLFSSKAPLSANKLASLVLR